MIEWLENNTLPEHFPQGKSHGLQSLWVQRQPMILHNGILYRQWEDVEGGGRDRHLQLVMPRSLVDVVLIEINNAPAGGHLGVVKTLEKARKRFYSIGQHKDLEEWCRRCKICASRKPQETPTKHRHAPLRMDITGNPLQRVAMDILGPLPVTHQNNKFILVIGDYFTKWRPILWHNFLTLSLCWCPRVSAHRSGKKF